jgi:hypothetical protein
VPPLPDQSNLFWMIAGSALTLVAYVLRARGVPIPLPLPPTPQPTGRPLLDAIRAIVVEAIANRPPRQESPPAPTPQVEPGPDGSFIVRLPPGPAKPG